MKLLGAYLFREKDPEIDELRTMIEINYGEKVSHKLLAKIERGGGASTSAMAGWFFGKTLRPQNSTMEASGRAMGFRRKWVKMTVEDREAIEKAVERLNKKKNGK